MHGNYHDDGSDEDDANDYCRHQPCVVGPEDDNDDHQYDDNGYDDGGDIYDTNEKCCRALCRKHLLINCILVMYTRSWSIVNGKIRMHMIIAVTLDLAQSQYLMGLLFCCKLVISLIWTLSALKT